MSEARARDERERVREEEEKRVRKQNSDRAQVVIKDIRENYAGVKALYENPEARKALLFIRRQMRKIRNGWKMKLLDARVPKDERDILLGQFNSVLLLFEVLERFKILNDKLIPGKEEECVLEMMRGNRPQQQR